MPSDGPQFREWLEDQHLEGAPQSSQLGEISLT